MLPEKLLFSRDLFTITKTIWQYISLAEDQLRNYRPKFWKEINLNAKCFRLPKNVRKNLLTAGSSGVGQPMSLE